MSTIIIESNNADPQKALLDEIKPNRVILLLLGSKADTPHPDVELSKSPRANCESIPSLDVTTIWAKDAEAVKPTIDKMIHRLPADYADQSVSNPVVILGICQKDGQNIVDRFSRWQAASSRETILRIILLVRKLIKSK